MKAIQAEKIYFAYNGSHVIQGVSLSLERGEFLGIIGPNGAGKSTLLRICAGILQPRTGSVFVSDEDLKTLGPKIRAQKVAFVPQETHFALGFSVEDIVHMGRFPYLRPFQRESAKDREAAEHALQYADIVEFRNRSIHSLSSGERQLAVIARALAQEPEIMLLDEPTSHLDLHHQSVIMGLLQKLNSRGMSIITINHDVNLASLYCQRLVLLHHGSVYADGPPQSVINEETLQTVYRTKVKIIRHPDKKVPQVFLQSGGG